MQEPEIQGLKINDVYEGMKERNVKGSTEKLAAAHVTIAGAGGLGSNIAIALTRIGVGHLTLIDFDTVELSNLNRQPKQCCWMRLPSSTLTSQLSWEPEWPASTVPIRLRLSIPVPTCTLQAMEHLWELKASWHRGL